MIYDEIEGTIPILPRHREEMLQEDVAFINAISGVSEELLGPVDNSQFIYTPPPDQEPIVDDRRYIELEDKHTLTDQEKRLIEGHIEYAKQVQMLNHKKTGPLQSCCIENVIEIVTEIEKIIGQCNEEDFTEAFNRILRNFQYNKYFNRSSHNST